MRIYLALALVTAVTPMSHGNPISAFLWKAGVMTRIGDQNSEALSINDAGQIVGSSGNHAALWSGGVFTDRGTLPGDDFSVATGINNLGQIVGASHLNGGGNGHIVLWNNGIPSDLGEGFATGINDAGQIVGFGATISNGGGFLWQNGIFTSLGSFEPFAINNQGQITGADIPLPGGLLYSNGSFFPIQPLNGDSRSFGLAINDSGEVAGGSTGMFSDHAIVWQNGVTTGLGGGTTTGNGLNNLGDVVGQMQGTRAFLWHNGTLTDIGIGSYGSGRASAFDINNNGEIVGWAEAPEPVSWLLFLVGLSIVAAFRGTRKRDLL